MRHIVVSYYIKATDVKIKVLKVLKGDIYGLL